MLSRISNFSGPLSQFFSGTQPKLLLSLDSFDYTIYGKSFAFDLVDSFGVTFSQNSVTSLDGGWSQNRVTSVETIPLGSPFKLKFKRGETLGDIMCGLSQDPPINNGDTYTRHSFGFYLGYGIGGDTGLSVTEGGDFSKNVITNGSYPASTVYTIVYDGIRVEYYVDDNLFYTSTTVPSDDLFLYIIFLQSNKSILDIEFGGINTKWDDTSGNNRNFSLVNSPKYLNGSFYFDKNFGQFATGSDLGSVETFTIDTWFNFKTLPLNNTYPQIVTNAYNGSPNPYVNFSIGVLNGVNNSSWDGKIMGGFFASGPTYWVNTDGFIPDLETWYNATLTYDKQNLNFYVNGNLFSSVTSSIPTTSSQLGLIIGKRFDLAQFIDGKIDVVKIWKGALKPTQILENYNLISQRYEVLDGSILLNGSSSIEIPAGSEFALGTSYTIEFWSRAATSSTGGSIFTVMSQADNDTSIDILYLSGNLVIRNGVAVTAEPTPGVWTHVAIVSDNGTLSVYYNGVYQIVSGSGGNLQDNVRGLSIGCRSPYHNFQYFDGYLYGIRINNTVVYTSNFDPYQNVLPPTNISGTVLLIKEYQTYTGNFIDSSYNKTIYIKGATHSSEIPLPTFRYFRWIITKTKSPDVSSNAVQVADLILFSNGVTASWNPSAIATNPDGYTNPGEDASSLLDEDSNTKWCDVNFGPNGVGTSSIYIDNITEISFDSYRYVTANDNATIRDPVSWTLSGSNDNSTWKILDTQIDVVITNDRLVNTQIFSIV